MELEGGNRSVGPARPLSWAVYLGVSWTWCIGMFLPVLIMRDYGIAGWLVFAIPNVVGAAAMGWILKRAGSSESIVREHRFMCAVFSAVTLSFHLYFLIWITGRIVPVPLGIGALAGGCIFAILRRKNRGLDRALAWGVYAVSACVLVYGLMHFRIADRHGLRPSVDLIWLAVICAFGFALCPYLDLTFHEAKQATDEQSGKRAFGLGFGLFFCSMIVLTMLYEGDIVWENGHGSFGELGLRTWVAVHLAVQIGFTWGAHLRVQEKWKTTWPVWLVALGVALAAGWIVWQPQLKDAFYKYQHLSTGEGIYRLYMAFYGLIFPAYVWICMVPLAGYAPGANRRSLAVWGGAIAIAGPMFWLAFIEGTMWWLGLGLAIVFAARLLQLPRQTSVLE